jgi:hypothetical protein
MALTASRISCHPKCHDEVRLHARALLDIHERFPRIGSVLASEQRGMMANIFLGLYFAPGVEGRRGVVLARFLDQVEARGVASRNTADAFIKEMVKYGYLSHFTREDDGRLRPLEPTEASMIVFVTWVMEHLRTLDNFDGGGRAGIVASTPEMLSGLQPQIAVDLVGEGGAAEYPRTLALFAWVNNSKLLTQRILAGMGDVAPDATHVSTDIDSATDLAKWLNISQTHFVRKLREAEELGSVGWEGRRGQSPMWISTDFLKEMLDEQTARFAIFDAAFDAVFGSAAASEIV